MIYRPVRERSPRVDRRLADRRRREGGLRGDRPDLPVDRGLLEHHAARQEARGRAAQARRVDVGRVAARVRPQRGSARRARADAHQRPDVRARGRHAAHARRRQQERHRGARRGELAPRVRARLAPPEAVLHDRPADRGGRRRARHRRDRPAHAARSAAAAASASAPRSRSASARTCPSRTRRCSGARRIRSPRSGASSTILRAAPCSEPGLRLKHHHSGISFVEGVLARGDRRLADVIETAWRAGARFDGWDEVFDLERWQRALAAHGVDVAGVPRHAAGHRAAAVGPHRRRPRGRLPARRVPQGAQGPGEPAVRQGRRHADPPHEPRGRRARSPQAGLLRLRRRVRSDEDARRSPGRAAHARRARARPRARAMPSRPTASSSTSASAAADRRPSATRSDDRAPRDRARRARAARRASSAPARRTRRIASGSRRSAAPRSSATSISCACSRAACGAPTCRSR